MTKKQELMRSLIGNGCRLLLICMFMTLIDLPSTLSYLSQRDKAKESEAKIYVGLMNKGQQAYFAENSVFGTSIEALGLGLKTETANYKYSVRITKKAAFSYGVSKRKESKGYAGGVFVVSAKEVDPNGAKHEILTTQSIICEADKPGTIQPAEPTYKNGEVVCGKGTTAVTK
ncbi:MAG: general secretion pathway protein GspH [Oscillatoriales cyanobacterium]|uniref:Type IV pilin-like G/H family protein n=1 Tax=Microcoleus anatoxicus PTRS2 TaxID=2705321 RepID=A0ABU8YV05_9CYAN|nr:MAG: general secretion pathway protein GspH [Oscillatoriales cyanobacterium]TAE00666.1 MAG: general secretion pathway protein GspH [Oscillatoriales cyanobacterium]